MLVGNKKTDDEFYVKNAESPQVFIVKKWGIEHVNKRPIDFRDKTICDIDANDLSEVAVTHGAESYTLVKSGKVPAMFESEGVSLLTRMPRLEAQRKLRKEYQALADETINADAFRNNRTKILDATRMTEAEAVRWADKVIAAKKHVEEEEE